MTFDELFHVFRLTEQCRKQTPPEGRRNFLMLFSLMNSIFDYSVIRFLSARARRSFAKSGRYNINQLRMALYENSKDHSEGDSGFKGSEKLGYGEL